SRNPALHTPRWLSLPQSHALATMCLVGGWSTENKADQTIVEKIAGRPYHEVEGDLSILSATEDAPVMRIDRVWKAKSPIELLALFGPQLTSSELDRFFNALRSILIEPDPELELPADERYAAQIHGKVRPQSGLLIRSLCDTLIKFAVRGVDIPGLQHLNLQERAAAFVRDILGSANASRWLSLSSLLRPLAEAAPDEFLKAIERSLSTPEQPVAALIRETGSSAMFGRCYHADLLWALELLAWAPERLTRVAYILAQLGTIPIKGNWGNSPQRSLLNLYRSWLPQTSASLEQRIASLDRLIATHADAAFALLDSLVHTHGDMAVPSARPRWRDDDAGSGRGVPGQETHKMLVEAAERMLSLADGNASRVVTLVEKISFFDPPRVARVLAICRDFTTADVSDHDKALVRAALRKHINHARNYGRPKGAALESHLRPIETLYEELTPASVTDRHAWLFENDWPDLPTRVRDENYQERAKLLEKLRAAAVREVYANGGLTAIAEFSSVTNGHYVGLAVAKLYPE